MRFASLDDWLAWQQSAHPRAIDPGLGRVGEVYRRLGSPRPPVALCVGGTNGKGSVVAYLDAMLRAAGLTTGTFTSPHLQRYAERIRIQGVEAPTAELLEAFDRIDRARGDVSLTFFEWNALAAFLILGNHPLEVAVLEVGMGGRLDAVNLIDADVAAVTSVGLDHCEWLGTTVEAIAAEKAGILRPGRPAVFGSRRMPAAIGKTAAGIGARLRRLGVDFDFIERPDGWDYAGLGSKRRELPLPALRGAAQLANAATALAILESAEPRLLVPDGAVRKGLDGVRLPGRFQCIGSDPAWILDVAHNPDAAEVLASSLAATRGKGRTTAVCGILGDKDVERIVHALAGQVDDWIAVGLEGPRALPVGTLAGRIGAALSVDVDTAASVAAGCALAASRCGAGDRIMVFGSFLTVGPALQYLGQAA